jgi:large subunit ribosomal protein L32e
MTKEKLLERKQKKKKRNPRFIRQDIHKKKRLSKLWRKPRGCDSKKRLMKNNRLIVKPGYGTPAELREKDRDGKDIVNINSLSQVKKIDPKKQVVIVSGKIGLKRRLQLLEELVKLKIRVHNISDPEEYIKKKKAEFLEKKKQKKKVEQEKEKKPVKSKKKKESVEDKLSEEEKKKIEKKEIDKLLTKK